MKPVKADGRRAGARSSSTSTPRAGGSVDRALAAQGADIWKRESCDDCHSVDGKSEGVDGAPNLGGRASVEWIARVIRDAGAEMLFSDRNEMPRFGKDKLSDDDVQALVALLRGERARAD